MSSSQTPAKDVLVGCLLPWLLHARLAETCGCQFWHLVRVLLLGSGPEARDPSTGQGRGLALNAISACALAAAPTCSTSWRSMLQTHRKQMVSQPWIRGRGNNEWEHMHIICFNSEAPQPACALAANLTCYPVACTSCLELDSAESELSCRLAAPAQQPCTLLTGPLPNARRTEVCINNTKLGLLPPEELQKE